MPAEVEIATQPARRKVFLSYAKRDRERVTGVKMLLELGGAEVFMDLCSIKPGTECETALTQALASCEILCVFWSAAAQRSKWVVAEYTAFLNRYPDRTCVPLCADATPLPPELAKRQAPPEFLALTNELLALRQHFIQRGISRREVQRIVRRRLAESGLEISERQMKTLLGMFATGASVERPDDSAPCKRAVRGRTRIVSQTASGCVTLASWVAASGCFECWT